MNSRALLPRLSLLGFTAATIAITAALFARFSLAPLAPSETNNGTISGQILGTSPNAQYVITITGIFSDNVTQFTTSTIVGGNSPYSFVNIPAGDIRPGGYTSTVTYTVSAAPLAPCYAVNPVSQTVILAHGQSVPNVNFNASYVPFQVTVTARLTEAVFHSYIIPVTPVIVPPAISNGIGNYTGVTYRVQSFDGTIDQSVNQNVSFFNTTQITFTTPLNTEPANGNCTMPFTVTVQSLVPPRFGVINWRYVPPSGSQVVTTTFANRNAFAPFLAYHYWTWTPFVLREP